MKVKLKGKLRNFLYQNAEWLFLLLYGKKCRAKLLIYTVLIGIVELYALFGTTGGYIILVTGIVLQVFFIYLLWGTRYELTISKWLAYNQDKIVGY